MAQGKTKLASKTPSGGRHNNGTTKKGKRVIPPKTRSEINHKIMQKVCCPDTHFNRPHLTAFKNLSAKINNSIERQMVAAASAGKLTIMKNTATNARPES
jgi:hypothetical protein